MSTSSSNPNETRLTLSIPAGFLDFKYGATTSFTLAVLLFFLPFITIRCNDVKLASATGIQIATGFKVEPGKQWESIGKDIFGDDKKTGSEKEDRDRLAENEEKDRLSSSGSPATLSKKDEKVLGANYFMVGAFLLGLAGAILSLVPFRQQWLFCVMTGWLGLIAFVLTMVSVLQQTKQFRVDIGMIKLSVNFTIWFFLSFVGFLIALLYSYKQKDKQWLEQRTKEITEYMNSWGYEGEKAVADAGPGTNPG